LRRFSSLTVMRMQWDKPRNLRGLHGSPGKLDMAYEWWADELKSMDMGLVKLIDDGGGSAMQFARECRQRGIMPIIRLWRDRPNPGTLPAKAIETARRYVDGGITRWFEVNNEPNLKCEWQQGTWPGDIGQNARTVMGHWLSDAQAIINVGGYPAFPALAQCK